MDKQDIERMAQMTRITQGLDAYWARHPELRFGEMLLSFSKDMDLLYLSDELLNARVTKALEKLKLHIVVGYGDDVYE